jgi:hypothetical protein
MKIIVCTKFVFQWGLCRVLEEQAPYGRNEENASQIQILYAKIQWRVLFFLRNMTELHMPLHRDERLTASAVCDVKGRALARCVVAPLPLRR